MMHKAGQDPARVVQCRVTDVNLVNWTVDVISQFDRYYYRDIQVGALYLHYNQGEGAYVTPDIGAVCMVTIPSDTSPPYVSSFLAPMESAGEPGSSEETVVTSIFGEDEKSSDDAPAGTRSRGGDVPYPQVDARFNAGRPPAKPGDIVLRGRDGNFAILHRGGVLQVGSTELAQRFYIPLANKILDISGNYEHMNTGGGVRWGIQEGPSPTNPPTNYVGTFRVFADDQFCDVRIVKGHVTSPVGEPDGDDGARDDLQTMGIGQDIIVYEIDLAQGGFHAGSGDLVDPSVRNRTKFRYFFDRSGNVFLRAEGAALLHVKGPLKVKAQRLEAHLAEDAYISAPKGLVLDGGTMAELRADVVRLQAGTSPVARVGDQVQLLAPTAQVTGTLNGSAFTGVITFTTPIPGVILSGNPNLLG